MVAVTRDIVASEDGFRDAMKAWVREKAGSGHEWGEPVVNHAHPGLVGVYVCDRCHCGIRATVVLGHAPRYTPVGSYLTPCTGSSTDKVVKGVIFTGRDIEVYRLRTTLTPGGKQPSWQDISTVLGVSRERAKALFQKAETKVSQALRNGAKIGDITN